MFLLAALARLLLLSGLGRAAGPLEAAARELTGFSARDEPALASRALPPPLRMLACLCMVVLPAERVLSQLSLMI